MPYSIEQLKGKVSQGGGIGAGNLYRVILPPIENSPIKTRDLDLLCSVTAIPGRQITSVDQMMGTTSRKIASGYAMTDLNLNFIVTNDHVARIYFEQWQNLAHDPNTYEVGYFKDYAKTVKIEHLQKGAGFPILKKQLGITKKIPSFIKNRLPKVGPLDLAQDEFDANFAFDDTPVFTVELREAFPTTINDIELGNDKEGFIEFNVQLSYKDWISNTQVPDDNLASSVVGGGISLIRRLFG